MKDSFKLGNKEFNSRFILGSGKYSNELINSAINYAEAEIVKKAEFSKINIKNTDKIEIVCFVGGG